MSIYNRRPSWWQRRRERHSPPSLASVADTIAARMSQARRERWSCELCGGPPISANVYIPADPQATGLPAGSHGAYVHTLCATCLVLPDARQRVEASAAAHAALQYGAERN